MSEESCKNDLSIERGGFEALLVDSEHLEAMGLEVVALAHKLCPEQYETFINLFEKHHNAGCGPLHRWARKKLSDTE